jgi:hypothetical protein
VIAARDGYGEEPPGATPLDDEDIAGLLPTWVATRGDLNVAEQENILAADRDHDYAPLLRFARSYEGPEEDGTGGRTDASTRQVAGSNKAHGKTHGQAHGQTHGQTHGEAV